MWLKEGGALKSSATNRTTWQYRLLGWWLHGRLLNESLADMVVTLETCIEAFSDATTGAKADTVVVPVPVPPASPAGELKQHPPTAGTLPGWLALLDLEQRRPWRLP